MYPEFFDETKAETGQVEIDHEVELDNFKN